MTENLRKSKWTIPALLALCGLFLSTTITLVGFVWEGSSIASQVQANTARTIKVENRCEGMAARVAEMAQRQAVMETKMQYLVEGQDDIQALMREILQSSQRR